MPTFYRHPSPCSFLRGIGSTLLLIHLLSPVSPCTTLYAFADPPLAVSYTPSPHCGQSYSFCYLNFTVITFMLHASKIAVSPHSCPIPVVTKRRLHVLPPAPLGSPVCPHPELSDFRNPRPVLSPTPLNCSQLVNSKPQDDGQPIHCRTMVGEKWLRSSLSLTVQSPHHFSHLPGVSGTEIRLLTQLCAFCF